MTEVQLFVIGVAASVIVWVLKRFKQPVSAGWLTTGVYVVSLGLALAFTPLLIPVFPPFVDAVTFAQALLTWLGDALVAVSPFVGFATLVYNVLLKAVLDKYAAPFLAKLGRALKK